MADLPEPLSLAEFGVSSRPVYCVAEQACGASTTDLLMVWSRMTCMESPARGVGSGAMEPDHPTTRLGRLRVQRRITQAALARATGLSPRTLQRLEHGSLVNPPIRYLANLALALDVPLQDVIEPDWERWTIFDVRALEPPEPGWWESPGDAGTWGRSPYARRPGQRPRRPGT